MCALNTRTPPLYKGGVQCSVGRKAEANMSMTASIHGRVDCDPRQHCQQAAKRRCCERPRERWHKRPSGCNGGGEHDDARRTPRTAGGHEAMLEHVCPINCRTPTARTAHLDWRPRCRSPVLGFRKIFGNPPPEPDVRVIPIDAAVRISKVNSNVDGFTENQGLRRALCFRKAYAEQKVSGSSCEAPPARFGTATCF